VDARLLPFVRILEIAGHSKITSSFGALANWISGYRLT